MKNICVQLKLIFNSDSPRPPLCCGLLDRCSHFFYATTTPFLTSHWKEYAIKKVRAIEILFNIWLSVHVLRIHMPTVHFPKKSLCVGRKTYATSRRRVYDVWQARTDIVSEIYVQVTNFISYLENTRSSAIVYGVRFNILCVNQQKMFVNQS